MLSEDYLLRRIGLFIAALQRLIGLRKGGDLIEAQQLLDVTLEELYGMRAELLRHMPVEELLARMTRNDQLDLDGVQATAELFNEQAELLDAQGSPDEARQAREQALALFLAAALGGGAWNLPDPAGQIDELKQRLAHAALDAQTRFDLYCYAEQRGELREAVDRLHAMFTDGELKEAAIEEAPQFYWRLLAMDEESLAEHGLSSDVVRDWLEISREDREG